MAVAITFDKARAQQLVDCLNNGTAIEGIRSTEDMLALIGACRVVVAGRAASVHPGTRYRKLPLSRRRVVRESFARDIQAAIEWYTRATQMVIDGKYDARFEARHHAVAEDAPEGEQPYRVVVTRGNKAYRPQPAELAGVQHATCPPAARAG